jgi:hypothetical protein
LARVAELCSTESHGFAGAYFSSTRDRLTLFAVEGFVQV